MKTPDGSQSAVARIDVLGTWPACYRRAGSGDLPDDPQTEGTAASGWRSSFLGGHRGGRCKASSRCGSGPLPMTLLRDTNSASLSPSSRRSGTHAMWFALVNVVTLPPL